MPSCEDTLHFLFAMQLDKIFSMIGWNVDNILGNISQRRSALLKIRKVKHKCISEFLFLIAQNDCMHTEGNKTAAVRVSIEFSGVKIFQVKCIAKGRL